MPTSHHAAPRRTPASRRFLPLLAAALATLAPDARAQQPASPAPHFTRAELARWGKMAHAVTIYRDHYGMPEIFGPTDPSVVFGIGYAMAEDNFWQLEDDYIAMLGRSSELYGDSTIASDVAHRLFQVSTHARAGYRRATPRMRAIADAFAGGINWYLATHPDVHPRLLPRWEGWWAYLNEFGARAVSNRSTIDGLSLRDWQVVIPQRGREEEEPGEGRSVALAAGDAAAGTADEMRAAYGGRPTYMDEGSNMWALTPARTTTGHTFFFINPHVGFFGHGQRYEVALHSGSGWEFSGFCILGTPIPRTGHNAHLGWSQTNNYADYSDVYIEKFDDARHPLRYRYGSGHRTAIEWKDSVRVRTDGGVETRVFTFRRTHHGPIVATRDSEAAVIRVARATDGGSLEQRYLMGKSRNLAEFRKAMERATIVGSNTMYADDRGHIFYVHGNAIPRRAPGVDPSQPLDGTDPKTEWRGYFTVEELPHALDPKSGYLLNTNSTPWMMSGPGDNPDSTKYPRYVALEPYNERAKSSQRLLSGTHRFTWDEWYRTAFDHHVQEADERVPLLASDLARYRQADAAGADSLQPLVDSLAAWNRESDTTSAAMTVFVLWTQQLARTRRDSAADADWRMHALAAARDQLERSWGTWRVKWGDINRIQRVFTSGQVPFSDDRPSIPAMGGPPILGVIHALNARAVPGQKRRYGVSGDSYVSIVEFGEHPRAMSFIPMGQSADSTSAHWFDQATLNATGHLKPNWWTLADVRAHAERSYHPGEAPPAATPAAPSGAAARTTGSPRSPHSPRR